LSGYSGPVAKSNQWDGYCNLCSVPVRKDEGVMVPDTDARLGYLILCVEHASPSSLEPPAPPEASKLPSIHQDEQKYER
jgi:hypothetical protein